MPRIAPQPAGSVGPVLRAAYAYCRRRFGQVPEPFAVQAHAPHVAMTLARHEARVDRTWKSVDPHLRELAVMAAAVAVDCPWCVDFGGMLADRSGADARKLADLPRWRESDAYTELERLVIEYAEAVSATPLRVTDDHVEALRRHLSEEQVVELTAFLALENARSRFNLAMGIEPQGYRNDACAVRA